MDIGQRIGQRIRKARKHAGLTQKELAVHLGKSGAAVAYLEQGKRRANAEVLIQVSEATSKPLSYFYEDQPIQDLGFSRRMDLLQKELLEIQRLLYQEQDRRKIAEDDVLLFKELFDQSNDHLVVWDADTGHAVTCNQRLLDDMGCERHEFLEKTIMEVEAGIPTLEVWHKIVGDLKANGATIMKTEPKRQDGTTFFVEVSVKYVLLDDQAYVVSAARNIMERDFHSAVAEDQQLQQYQSLLECLQIPVLICQNEGKVLKANEAFRKVFSVEKKSFEINDTLLDSIPEFLESVKKCGKSGKGDEIMIELELDTVLNKFCVRIHPIVERSYITQVLLVFQPVI